MGSKEIEEFLTHLAG
ncbi:hypothetical protein [Nostoc sp. TCL26-01]